MTDLPTNRPGARWAGALLRRSLPLTSVLLLAAAPACTSPADGGTAAAGRSYEEAKAQVPLNGNEREPLYWEVEAFSDPRVAAAAEAVQYYFVIFEVLADTRQPDDEFFELMSHFATDERVEDTRSWFTGPRSPSPEVYEATGPRWLWIMDVRELPSGDLGATVCIDAGWYGYHPDGVFRRLTGEDHQAWGLSGYVVRQVEEDGGPRWKVDDDVLVSRMLPEATRESLRERCIAWAQHEWEANDVN